MKVKVLSVYLTPEEYEALRALAQREKRSMSGFVRYVLDKATNLSETASFFEQGVRDGEQSELAREQQEN